MTETETVYELQRDLERFLGQDLKIFSDYDGIFVRSFSNDRGFYKVTPASCECKSFEHRGHCKHHAGFMAYALLGV